MTDTTPTNAIRPTPDKIIVPRKHGQLLIEPPLSELASAATTQTFSNKKFLSQNLTDLRASAREQLKQSLAEWSKTIGRDAPELKGPFIFTGHQVEFYHAGVWAKVLAADELAKRTNGTAIDLLVDHDTVDHRGFDLPNKQDDTWKREPADYAQPSNIPADGLPAPTRQQFESWDAAIAKFPLAHEGALPEFLTNLAKLDNKPTHTAWLSRARTAFESSMNLHVAHIPTSLLCRGHTWDLFVNAWIQNATTWTSIYNQHLAAYRKRQGIKNPQQPMPDLAHTQNEIELPFWAYRQGEPRQRVTLRNTTLFAGEEKISPDFQIRPRALTLTMYIRLFLADIFIHGIGGALYDQITDRLMEELFDVSPPYGCVSAAWLLPLGQAAEDAGDLPHLHWQLHHTLHNPQQSIDPFTALKTEIAERIRDRRTLIEQITASLQTHRKDPTAKKQRYEWFTQLHALNADLHTRCPRPLQKLDTQIESLLTAQAQNKVLLWREYFFPLHTRASLEALHQKIRST